MFNSNINVKDAINLKGRSYINSFTPTFEHNISGPSTFNISAGRLVVEPGSHITISNRDDLTGDSEIANLSIQADMLQRTQQSLVL